jgi:hypothetical protein
MNKQDLFKKLCDFIKKVGQDNAYVSYKEGCKSIKHVILYRDKGDLFIVSNNYDWDGAVPDTESYKKYGRYSWIITKEECFYRNVIPEINFRVITKEELAELLDTTPDVTIIIQDTKTKEKTII